MQQEHQFQIGDRVLISEHDHKGFYGIVEELRPTLCDVRMYDGKLAMWISSKYLKKVDPYDIRYVMPGDLVKYKYGDSVSKIWDVRPYVIGVSWISNHSSFLGFFTREELQKDQEIHTPIGNSNQEQEDDWEEVEANKLIRGDIYIKEKEPFIVETNLNVGLYYVTFVAENSDYNDFIPEQIYKKAKVYRKKRKA